jgi:Ca2+-binding RTX toxin-like protein
VLLRRYARCAASAVALALGVAIAIPAVAFGTTTVRYDPVNTPFTISVDGDSGSNHLELAFTAAGKLAISTPGIAEASPTCTDEGDTIVCAPPPTSPRQPPFPLVFGLGEGNNSLHVSPSFPASIAVDFRSGAGIDSFSGGPEPDRIDSGPGADVVSGGPGTDQMVYAPRITPVAAELNGMPVSGNELDGPPGSRDAIAGDVEDMIGGNAGDLLTGNALANRIEGFKGHDILRGLGGDDELLGDDLSDRVKGGRGNDLLIGAGPGDSLFGGPGNDRIDAKDKQHEKAINCGAGNDRRERATRDRGDPHPISC